MHGHMNVEFKIFSTVINANMDTSDCRSSKGPRAVAVSLTGIKKCIGECLFIYIGTEDTTGFKFSHRQRRGIDKFLGRVSRITFLQTYVDMKLYSFVLL